MADALFILIVIGFFGLMVLLVRACDHIIGPDDLAPDPSASIDEDAAVGAEVAVR
jgi:hypothetical protein